MTYNTSVASAISSNALIFNYMRWTQKDRKKNFNVANWEDNKVFPSRIRWSLHHAIN